LVPLQTDAETQAPKRTFSSGKAISKGISMLIRIYCPFKVSVKVTFPQIEAGRIVRVEKAQVAPDLKNV
jgi:hypothetical protein